MPKETYRKLVPAQVRTFIETLAGDTSPITESNFTPEELELIRRTVRNAKERHPVDYVYDPKTGRDIPVNSTTYVGYPDYDMGARGQMGDLNALPEAAIRNTLGRFRVDRTPEGRAIAVDSYDFADDLAHIGARKSSEYERMSTAEKLAALAQDTLKTGGINSLPSRIGSAFIGKRKRPVRIDLGEGLRKGGAVKAKTARGDGCAKRGKTKGRLV